MSGVLLAVGASLGAWLNRHLIKRGFKGAHLLGLGAILALSGGIGAQLLPQSVWFVAPMMLVVLAFGVAILNVLGQALAAYPDRLGTAGALLGLMYYLMIGVGMFLTGWAQALGGSLMICGYLAVCLGLLWQPRRDVVPVT